MTPSTPIRRPPATDRHNPPALTLVALTVIVAGAAALAASFESFGESASDAPVLPEALQRFARDNTGLLELILLVAGLALFLVALRWLLVQLRVERLGEVLLEPDDTRGQTTIAPTAVTNALEDEASRVHGVTSASARLVHDTSQPDLHLVVDLGPRADLREVRTTIENDVMQHARETLSREELPALIQYRLARGGAQRAR